MIILLSPAKIQNFSHQNKINDFSLPEYLNEAKDIVAELKKRSLQELKEILKVKDDLALKAFGQYFNFGEHDAINAKQALLVYAGEVFRGMGVDSFVADDFHYAQSHLRIFSGLYGVLRPLDLIQPYRLDVSANLKMNNDKNLYDFWGEIVTKSLNDLLRKDDENFPVVNLASKEYFNIINTKKITNPILNIEFFQHVNNEYKQITIYTKKARGLMSRFIIKNRITEPEDLIAFDEDNYWYNPSLSSEDKFIFIKDYY
jgi:cytoplasmic iron level regulating protein YaaA (DUF328/UPF0246 family)